jgi:small subunit ribosomal protein S20
MAQIKSQMKRIKTNEKARQANVSRRSQMRTAIKATKAAVAANNYAEALELSKKAEALIDHARQDGILKLNSAARKKSQLMSLVASIKPAEKAEEAAK